MKWFYASLALVLTVCAVVLTRDADRVFVSIPARLDMLDKTIASIKNTDEILNQSLANPQHGLDADLTDLHRTEIITAGAISNIERSSRSWQKKQEQATDALITDERNLGLVLTSSNTTMESLSNLLQDQQSQLSSLEADTSRSIMQIGALSDSLGTQITGTLSSVQVIAANGATATGNLVAVTDDAKAISNHYRKQITAPVNKAKWAVEEAARAAGKFFGGMW